MAAAPNNLKLLGVFVVLCVLLTDPLKATAAITCGDVNSKLSPCKDYLTSSNKNVAPPNDCCKGVVSLNKQAHSTADRQAACKCIKEVLPLFPNINKKLAEALPGNCGVNLPYKISTSIDCNKVH